MKPAEVAKAIVGFVGGVAAGLTTAAADGTVSGVEVLIAVLGGLGLAAGVWATPNRAQNGS